MTITAGTVAVGEAVWRAIAPVKLIKRALNVRRKRLGKPLLPITKEDETMLPAGKATHTGAAIAASGPVVGFLIAAFVPPVENFLASSGFAPVMCAPEAPSCVTAGMLAFGLVTGLVTAGGSALASWGRKRAEKRHAAQLAAVQAATNTPAPPQG